jgi:Ser/Thr protein kinase RdoA (MazF antagonist)
VLINSCEVITAVDPVQRVAGLAGRRPGLGGYLAARSWADDLAAGLLPAIRRAAPHLRLLPRQWGHGDWHPSNLTWTSAAPDAAVAAVFDLGLANRTFAVHDLAVAIERTAVAWLDLAEPGPASTGLAGLADRAGPADLAGLTDPAGPTDLAGLADLAGLDALLDGYRSVRPLAPAEAAALPEVLPVCHVEYALSEVEYFASVLGSPALADLAYHGYLLGHARWFTSPAGQALLAHLRRVLRDRRSR